jgi:F420H(2)-dependent quinone reductase
MAGSGRAYLRASWIRRRIVARMPWLELAGARLASRVIGDPVLEVNGRRTGRMHATLARPLMIGSERYLVGIRGDTHWARNLRAAGQATLRWRGVAERVAAVEATGTERDEVVRAYLATSNYTPTRRIMTEVLPKPEQHPVFRIEAIKGGASTDTTIRRARS